jgi:hypothetical protein
MLLPLHWLRHIVGYCPINSLQQFLSRRGLSLLEWLLRVGSYVLSSYRSVYQAGGSWSYLAATCLLVTIHPCLPRGRLTNYINRVEEEEILELATEGKERNTYKAGGARIYTSNA